MSELGKNDKKTSLYPILLCLPLGLMAPHLIVQGFQSPHYCQNLLTSNPQLHYEFSIRGISELYNVFGIASVVAGVVFFITSILGLCVKQSWTLSLVRKAYIVGYLIFMFYVHSVFNVTGVFLEKDLPLNGEEFNAISLFFKRYDLLVNPFAFGWEALVTRDATKSFDEVLLSWPALWIWPAVWVLLLGFMHVQTWRRVVIDEYAEQPLEPDVLAPGDLLLENVRTHGRDPEFRKSWLSSVFTHVFILIILPWLLQFIGCVEPYRVPKGTGNPVVALVQVVQPKKKKKKKYILNPNTDIIFHLPDLEESETLKEVQMVTEMQYRADPNAHAGKTGAGGGKTGGWPDGMDDAEVRFIRLQHNGHGWEDGMDTGADQNFLKEFHKLTGFKCRDRGEAHQIHLLSKYPKGYAPPFVYMTGTGPFTLGTSEIKVLRDYLMDGGMLFGDANGPGFHTSFVRMMDNLIPGTSPLFISRDDPIFQMPFQFPQGPPRLWNHGDGRTRGIKIQGRWAVFYFPGDVNDYWKTGRSGASSEDARKAFNLGVNIVYHAFTNYLTLTKKYRK